MTTAHERANEQARQLRAQHSWRGLIAMQRRRRIVCELEKLELRLAELRETDPDRYYAGDWNEVYDSLIFWQLRDPHDEAQWTVTV